MQRAHHNMQVHINLSASFKLLYNISSVCLKRRLMSHNLIDRPLSGLESFTDTSSVEWMNVSYLENKNCVYEIIFRSRFTRAKGIPLLNFYNYRLIKICRSCINWHLHKQCMRFCFSIAYLRMSVGQVFDLFHWHIILVLFLIYA